jgi:stage V sporulation protein D (sporulation-specific penicillin-binding protein)
MGIFLTVCIMGLMFSIWRIQSSYGEEYAQWAAAQRAVRDTDRNTEFFTPVRGGFVDRFMQPLTGTDSVFTVYLDVYALHERYLAGRRSSPDLDIREPVFSAISSSLGVSRWELLPLFDLDDYGNLAMQAGRRRRVLAHDVPADIAIPLTEQFVEVRREESSLRWYHDPFFAPQVLGFIRGDSIWGLEARYRAELEGTYGRTIWTQDEVETIPVVDGRTIVTTLDGDIQRLAQDFVNRTFINEPSQYVGLIVMQPFTGEVIAMAQAPTFSLEDPFNPDFFTCTHLQEVWPYLDNSQRANDVMRLWRNYHTTRSNEPGSTFKPFVIAAAIEEDIITQHNRFHCVGRMEIADQVVWCHNEFGCGALSLRRALAISCNLAMVDINHRMGRDTFYRYRGYFGFGERTGIDLPGEEAVDSHYVMYPWSRLGPVEMATSSMGQGFNATTMQIINGYAALINGGNLMQPFLVSQIVDQNGFVVHETQPTVVRRVISEETSDFIREEMRYAVSGGRDFLGDFRGTGWRSYIAGHSVGGKTGTAQQGIRGGGEYISTYVAFFPVEDPQFLILMTIDRMEDVDTNTHFAGALVAPIVRDFIAELIRMRNIQPVDQAAAIPEIFGTPTPDWSGRRLADITPTINAIGGGGFFVVGNGTTISHHTPAPGQPMPETAPVIFFMDPDSRIYDRMVIMPNIEGLNADAANQLLLDVGLPAVLFRNRPAPTNQPEGRPTTANPEPLTEHNHQPPAPLPYTIYSQFPAAGSEIERGTQVMLRAR